MKISSIFVIEGEESSTGERSYLKRRKHLQQKRATLSGGGEFENPNGSGREKRKNRGGAWLGFVVVV